MSARSKNLWTDYRWRESGWTRARAVLSLGMVFGLGAVGTMAYWTDTATAESGQFSAGEATIDLRIDGEPEDFSFGVLANLARGQSVAGMFELQNNGTADLVYSVDLLTAELTNQVGTGNQARGSAASLRENMTVSLFEGGGIAGDQTPEMTCTGALLSAEVGPSVDATSLRTGVQLPGATANVYCVQALVHADAPIASRMAQVGVSFSFNATIA